VGIIPVFGPVDQRLTGALLKAGGTATEEISAALDAMLADPSISTILLQVDSPGGTAYGIEELSDKIYQTRGQKPIWAIADSMAASAAYWIASSADQLFASPGADVGSVGVYLIHADESKALEQEGVKVTLVRAGKYKAEMAPFLPLSADAIGHMQERVDDIYARFLGALKRNRGVPLEQVRSQFGQGRLVAADQARAAGMIDKVMTFEELLDKLGGAPVVATRGPGMVEIPEAVPGTSLEVLRARHAQNKRKLLEGTSPAFLFTHNSVTADREPAWSTVDKTKLPDMAFADREGRRFPHHWVRNGGAPDEKGRFTTGTLFLHREGLNAAWAAANGARSGDKAEPAVIAHLQAHRKALGLDQTK
jgi:signal peptide peptidase SppA